MAVWKLSLVAALAALMLACATTQDEGSLAAVKYAANDPDRVTCKTEMKTGTRLKSKTCMTNRAWRARATNARAATEQIQDQSVLGGTRAGN